MNHLFRSKAPISEAAWAEIDSEATTSLKELLAARRIVDVSGPNGWSYSAEPTGRVASVDAPSGLEVQARLRQVQPLVEFRTPFTLDRAELDAIDRGACDADLDPVRFAARRAAMAEDRAVFHGYTPGGIVGLTEASPHESVIISSDYDEYPSFVATATARLKLAGVTGPYAIALGPRCYTGVIEQSEMGGYPVLEHLRLILGGPVVFAPGVDGAVVVSLRGGDFDLVLGQDLSIGYLDHDVDTVELYIEESFTLKVCSPEAAIYLRYAD
jgi:uncharacterized linocin/CFP29 family protein